MPLTKLHVLNVCKGSTEEENCRYLDEDEYHDWNLKSIQAKLEINDREQKVADVDELIEVNLELIGATAIEDRL